MGIETSPLDVEESTEPPIRPCKEERQTQLQTIGSGNLSAKSSTEIAETVTAPLSSKRLPNDSQEEKGSFPNHGPKRQVSESLSEYAHTLDPSELASILHADPQYGLSSTEAASRLHRDGPNRVREMETVSIWKILLRQVSNSLTFVLLITMAISFGIEDYIEGSVITAVILLNVVVGFVQDYRAEKTILSLHRLSAPTCNVIRDGHVMPVKAESLVVGDFVQLSVGDIVPADMRLFDGINVAIDEALLTGESLPVSKNLHATLPRVDIPIGDRINMAYSACSMTQGRASGIVTATGMTTEVGKIAQLLQDKPTDTDSNVFARAIRSVKDTVKNLLGLIGTPLQVKLSKFALLLFAFAVLLAIIVFSVSLWDIEGDVLIYGICVAVAVVPESLIAVLTITVAVGTKTMAKGNVIVRKLQCLEAVGGVTNICSDKTGTLTQGKMIARTAWIPGAGTLTVHQTTNPYDPTSGMYHSESTPGAESVLNTRSNRSQ